MRKTFCHQRFTLLAIGWALLMLTASCSQKSKKKTPVAINIVTSAAFAAITGSTYAATGAMLYGVDQVGNSFGRKLNSESITLELENGLWNFFLITWNDEFTSSPAYTGDMAGKSYCATATALVEGQEDALSVDLSLMADLCSDQSFGPSNSFTNNQFPTVDIISCKDDVLGVQGPTHSGCQNSPAIKGKSPLSSYKVYLVSFDGANGDKTRVTEGLLKSECLQTHNSVLGNLEHPFGAKFPIGSTVNSPFYTIIRGFYGPNCAASQAVGYEEFHFKSGLHGTPKTAVSTEYEVSFTPSERKVFLAASEDKICAINTDGSGRGALTTYFSAGDGSVGSPAYICNKSQFNLIGGNNFSNYMAFPTATGGRNPNGTLYREGNYILLKDLDFKPQGSALNSNFVMIGTGLDPYNTNATDHQESASFSGRFNGAGHSLSNIVFIKLQNAEDIGVFRKVGSGVSIENLTIKNTVFECEDSIPMPDPDVHCEDVGILIGELAGGTNVTTLSNILVHGFIAGHEHVGGLAGSAYGLISIEKSHSNIHAEADRKLGGLIGYATLENGSLISETSYFGELNSHPPQQFSTENENGHIGGLVGSMHNPNTGSGNLPTIQSSVAKGKIFGSNNIGGLVGTLTSGKIQNSYTNIHTAADNRSFNNPELPFRPNVGGLVGRMENNAYLEHSFSHLSTQNAFGYHISDPLFNLQHIGGAVGSVASASIIANITSVLFSGNNNRSDNPLLFGGTAGSGAGAGDFKKQSLLQDKSTYEAEGFDFISTNAPWEMAHDTYEAPRPVWEAALEERLPYLKRQCTQAMYQASPGSSSDICSLAQFKNISPGGTYNLRKSLDFTEVSSFIPFSEGAYTLNGNNFDIMNLSIHYDGAMPSGKIQKDIGIFQSLHSSSHINQLHLLNIKIENPIKINSFFGTLNIGVLAGRNYGTISDIKIEDSSVKMLEVKTVESNDTAYAGGIVGQNLGDGIIEKSEIGTELRINASFQEVDTFLRVGGITGFNEGSILGIRNHSRIEQKFREGNFPQKITATLDAVNLISTFTGDRLTLSNELCANGGNVDDKSFLIVVAGTTPTPLGTHSNWQEDEYINCQTSPTMEWVKSTVPLGNLAGTWNASTNEAIRFIDQASPLVVTDNKCTSILGKDTTGRIYQVTENSTFSLGGMSLNSNTSIICDGLNWKHTPVGVQLILNTQNPGGLTYIGSSGLLSDNTGLNDSANCFLDEHEGVYYPVSAAGTVSSVNGAPLTVAVGESIYCSNNSGWQVLNFNLKNIPNKHFNGIIFGTAAISNAFKITDYRDFSGNDCNEASEVNSLYFVSTGSTSGNIIPLFSGGVQASDFIICESTPGLEFVLYDFNGSTSDETFFAGITAINSGNIEIVDNNASIDITNLTETHGKVAGAVALLTGGKIKNTATNGNFSIRQFNGVLGGVIASVEPSTTIDIVNNYYTGGQSSFENTSSMTGHTIVGENLNAILVDSNYSFVDEFSLFTTDTQDQEYKFSSSLEVSGILYSLSSTAIQADIQGDTVFSNWNLNLENLSLSETAPGISDGPIWIVEMESNTVERTDELPKLNFFEGGLYMLRPGFPLD